MSFDAIAYLLSIHDAFMTQFQPDGADADSAVFKDIPFVETGIAAPNDRLPQLESYAFEQIDLALPALLLDLQGAKLNPITGEYKDTDTSMHASLGRLALYAMLRAVVIVNTRAQIPHTLNAETFTLDPQSGVRKLAFAVAAFINAQRRFGQPCGMSQVSHIQPIPELHARETSLIAWEVRWQHTVEIGVSDYSTTDPVVNASAVNRVMVGIPPHTENPVVAAVNRDASGQPVPDDPNTALDESHFDTRQGYLEIYRRRVQ